MAADNEASIILTAKDETSAAFTSAKAGLEKFQQAYAQLGSLAGGAVVAGLVATGKSTIDLGDEMNDLSQKVGISVQNLATWTLAANQSGTSIESVAKGVKGLSQFMVANSAALAKAGITATDANGALIQLADLFEAMPDGVEKTALAVKLFGKAGIDMIPMLNQGSAGLQEAADKAAEYGRRMALLAPLADKFNDQMAELSLQSKETGIAIVTGILPGLIGMATWLNDIKAGGERAETALEFLSEKSPLFRGLVEVNKFLNGGESRSQGYPGPTNALGLPNSKADQDAAKSAADDAAKARAKKERAALDRAQYLLDKQARDSESSYLAGLRQQINVASGDISEYSKQLLAISQGPAKEFSRATKAAALALALKIDKLKEATKANEDHAKVLEKVARIEDAANKSVADFGFKQEQNVAGIDARAGALGKTPFEQKQAEAAQSIEKDYAEAVKRVNEELGKIGDIEGISEKTYALAQARDKAHVATAAALDEEKAKQDALDASWEYGANTALRNYTDLAKEAGKATGDAVTRGLSIAEDALVQFGLTGRLTFKSLVDYAEGEFIRLSLVRPAIASVNNLVKDSGGVGGLFGSIKSLFGFASGGAFTVGGAGGTDSQLVAFKATPGEEVSVRTPGQQGGGITIQQHIYPSPGVSLGDLMQAMVAAKNAAVAEIHNSMRRGGAFA